MTGLTKRLGRYARFGLGLISVVLFLIIWDVSARLGLVDVRYVSRPPLVFQAAVSLMGEARFWNNLWISSREFFLGMIVASAVGIPLGIAMGAIRRLRLLCDPMIMIFYSVPGTTFLPLIILWFGIGISAYAFLVFFSAVFPILVNSMVGMKEVDPVLVRAARSFGAGRFDIFRFVLLPSSLSFIMNGIRLGLGRGLIAVVLGEMYFSVGGVGNMIMKFQAGLNTEMLLALACLIALSGVFMILGAMHLELKLAPWRHAREVE